MFCLGGYRCGGRGYSCRCSFLIHKSMREQLLNFVLCEGEDLRVWFSWELGQHKVIHLIRRFHHTSVLCRAVVTPAFVSLSKSFYFLNLFLRLRRWRENLGGFLFCFMVRLFGGLKSLSISYLYSLKLSRF